MRIQCLVFGDHPDSGFFVNVSNTDEWSVLKKKIKQGDPVRFAQVSYNELELRLVNFHDDAELESKLEDFKPQNYPKPSPRQQVSSSFTNANPPSGYLHVIVIAPGTLNLFCIINAENMHWKDILLVKIDSRKFVDELKVAIKERRPNEFDKINAHALNLFQVSIPEGPISAFDFEPSEALSPAMRISQLFPRVLENHLHIVIQLPVAESRATEYNMEEERRDHISALNKRFQNVVLSALTAKPPSTLARVSNYLKFRLKYSIYDGRYPQNGPGPSVALPIQLFHPVFGRFLDDLKDANDIPDSIIRPTAEYMKASSAIYTTEKQRRDELTPNLCRILDVDIQTMLNDDELNAEGVIEVLMDVGFFLIFLEEVQGEFPEGGYDPSTHAGLTMARFWTQPKFDKLRNITNCPTFVIAFSGPWILVLGAVFTDGLIIQRLTDYIWVGLDSALSEARILRIAKIFYALKRGLDELKPFYHRTAAARSFSYLPAESRYFPSINSYYTAGEELISFKYVGYLEDCQGCATLRAQTLTTSPRDIVVKFVDRYGERAHRLLWERGWAPELIYCGSLRHNNEEPYYGSLSMVVMEFVEGEPLAKSKLNRGKAGAVRKTLEDILTVLHENGLVHGDIRPPNVMITAEENVKLIDFDWAGEEGQVKYPCLLSPAISWPMGVQSLDLIKKGHDLSMLEKLFSEPAPFITPT